MEMSEQAVRHVDERGRAATERENERNAEAAKQLTEAELHAARMFRMSPSEYLRFKSVRP